MRTKVLILGASGLLGRAMLRQAPPEVAILAPAQEELPLEDPDAILGRIAEQNVGRVLLLAAWTQVDACESDPGRAFLTNGILPGRLGVRLARRGIPLAFVSTDYVFDGTSTVPHREHDAANPLGVYGRSKWYGECALRESGVDLRIVRVSGLYGPGGADFVTTLVPRLAQGPVRVVDDQRVAPTPVDDLAPALWKVALSDERGIFHLPMQGETTWFGFARVLATGLGYSSDRVLAITTAELGRRAPRPAYSILDGQRARETFGLTLPTWEDGLARRVLELLAEGAGAHEERS